MPKPTAVQLECLRRLAVDRVIYRLHWGFWVTKSTAMSKPADHEGPHPSWWVTIQTVRAMEKRGWIERVHASPAEWCASRRITQAGLDILNALEPVALPLEKV